MADSDPNPSPPAKPRRHRRWRIVGIVLLVFVGLLGVIRLFLPRVVTWYVNQTLDQNPMYDGRIGDVDLYLWRGAYAIDDVRIVKTTGNVPVPLFAAKRVDLAIQWDALWKRKIVGRIALEAPELNFVDAEDESSDQTGAGGPWLDIIQDLFPFRINAAEVRNGSIHFRAFGGEEPVDVYLSHLTASVENLTNIHDETAPMISTVRAKALAMDHAQFEYEMKLDPFSYRPTFQLAVRLLGLDVTKVNALSRTYGSFDFERGWFDLVVELDAKEAQLEGYVKPLFRDLQVVSLKKDAQEDNVLGLFWEAVVGVTGELLENQKRDQLATVVPLRGDLSGPETDLFAILGNVLRNAFIHAFLPKFEGVGDNPLGLEFGPGTPAGDPIPAGYKQ